MVVRGRFSSPAPGNRADWRINCGLSPQESLGRDINHAVIPVRFAPNNRGDIASCVFEDYERTLGEVELQHGFLLIESAEAEGLFVNEERLWFFSFVDLIREIVEEVGLVVPLV